MLPFFAGRFGLPDAAVGTLITATALFATLSSPAWGALSDRFGRKPALLGSQAASLAGYLLLAFANGIPMLFASRVVEGLGGGNLGVANSYIGDVTTEEQRPQAFAFATAAFGGGFIVGPILGGALAHMSPTLPFFVGAALQAINIVLTATLLPEREGGSRASISWSATRQAFATPAIDNVLLRELLYIFAFTYFFTIFSLYLSHVLHADPLETSLLLGVAGAVGAGMQIFGVDPLVRRYGQRANALVAFALGIAAYGLLGFVHDLALFVIAVVLWAISGSLLRPVLSARISDLAPEAERGTLLGVSGSLDNFAMIFAPVAGSAIVGSAPRLVGVLPALALALGFALTLWDRDAKKRASAVSP